LDQTIIAGGFFSNYTINPVSIKFPFIFDLLTKEKDIDIYILTNDIKTYVQIYQKKLIIFRDRANGYSFSSFKILTDNYETVNFIFPNTKNGITQFSMLNDFDFDFSKIFYSYKFDSVFVHIHLFEDFRNLSSTFFPNYKIKDLNVYKKKLNFFYKCFSTIVCEMREEHESCLKRNFWRYDLTRFIKYVFKGFFCYEETEEIIKIISFYEKPLIQFLKKYYEKK
jgi:hypothetical protein